MNALLAAATSSPESHSLIFLGIGLIIGSLLLRRLFSLIAYVVAPPSRSENISGPAK